MLFAVATGTVYIKTSLSLLFSFSIYECLFISRLHNNGCLFWSQWHWMGIVLFSEVKTLINVVFFVVFFTCNQPLNYGETHQLQGCKAFFFFFFSFIHHILLLWLLLLLPSTGPMYLFPSPPHPHHCWKINRNRECA